MKVNASTLLVLYGVFLFACGLAGYLSNPERAKTALISGAVFGSLSIAWGLLVRPGRRWALGGALSTLLLLAGAFTWRSFAGWTAVAGGDESKVVAASLITAMLVGTVAVLPAVYRAWRSCGQTPVSSPAR